MSEWDDFRGDDTPLPRTADHIATVEAELAQARQEIERLREDSKPEIRVNCFGVNALSAIQSGRPSRD